jgi:hypothetical protein
MHQTSDAQLPDDAKAYIPSSDTCKRVLRRFCAQNRPREPQTLQELDIDGAWPMTTGDNPQPFLLHDNGSDANERVVIFAKEHHHLFSHNAISVCQLFHFFFVYMKPSKQSFCPPCFYAITSIVLLSVTFFLLKWLIKTNYKKKILPLNL